MDPRWFQILALFSLYLVQQVSSDFSINIFISLAVIIFMILLEVIANKLTKDPKQKKTLHSSVITGISLSLLLRASSPLWIFGAGALAIISKRTIRCKTHHIFNPANIGIVLLLVLVPENVWTASGVWGKYWLLVLLFSSYGLFLTKKVQRLDISLSFLFFYLGLHALRLLWLGDPFHLLVFRANSLALIVFSFFMISDPKTTPRSISGRVLFAFLVATLTFIVDAVLFRRNGLFFALALASPLVILINKFFSGERFLWPAQQS